MTKTETTKTTRDSNGTYTLDEVRQAMVGLSLESGATEDDIREMAWLMSGMVADGAQTIDAEAYGGNVSRVINHFVRR